MASVAFGGNKICRCCLRSCENPFNIFDLNKYINTTPLTQCLLEICDVQVSQDDNLPESICIPCYDYLKNSYTFRLKVQKNNSFLISILREDLIEELPNTDNENIEIVEVERNDNNNELKYPVEEYQLSNIEITETNECNNEIQYPGEEYQFSNIKYVTDNEVALINNQNNDDDNPTNFSSTNSNSTTTNDNNYINEFVNYIDDMNKDKIEIKNFICNICNSKFKYLRNLQFHEKQHHIQIGYKHCQYCSKRFYKNYDLRRHIQIEHIKIKEYSCSICKCKFYTKAELNRHIKYHSNIRNFQCLQCGQKFYDKSTLDVHIRVVHLKEKNYKCEFCSKKFATNSKVRRHQASQICNATATKIISTINVGQHLVILDYDPNSNVNIDENNKSKLIAQENLIIDDSISSNFTSEEIIDYNVFPDEMHQITDPVQKFLN